MDTTQPNGSKEHVYPLNVVEPGRGASVGTTAQDEYVFSVRELLGVLWRRLWVILLVMGLLTGAVVGLALLRTPTYEATSKIVIREKQENAVPGSLGGDVVALQQVAQTMAEAIPTRPVAEAVIDELNLDLSPEELLGNLSVVQVGTTQFIDVTYEAEGPEEAKQIADTVGAVFSTQATEVSPSADSITATVWEKAAVPDSPASPNPLRDGLLALVVSGMLGLGLALLLERLDNRWRSPEKVERISGVPIFGVIPKEHGQRGASSDLSAGLVTISDTGGAASEAYRTLRISLLYSLVDTPSKVIVVTSSGAGEGKSTICANLAVVLAQAGKNTLVMDCNLRKPVIHEVFGSHNSYGVVNALVGGDDLLESSWLHEPVPGLKVATAGAIPPNPAELLGSRRFAHLLARAREAFDYVLLDAPSIGSLSDPAILAPRGDGVLLVVDSQNTRKVAHRQSLRSLEAVGANVLGIVMNNVKKGADVYHGYEDTQLSGPAVNDTVRRKG